MPGHRCIVFDQSDMKYEIGEPSSQNNQQRRIAFFERSSGIMTSTARNGKYA